MRRQRPSHARRTIQADTARDLVRAAGVVEGEVTPRQAGLLAALFHYPGAVVAHEQKLQHVRIGLGDQLRGAADRNGHDVHHHDLHRTQPAGTELPPVVRLVLGAVLHRYPDLAVKFPDELQAVGRGHLIGPDQRAHRAHIHP